MTSSRSLGPTASTTPPRNARALRHVTTAIVCTGLPSGAPARVGSPADRVVLS